MKRFFKQFEIKKLVSFHRPMKHFEKKREKAIKKIAKKYKIPKSQLLEFEQVTFRPYTLKTNIKVTKELAVLIALGIFPGLTIGK